MGPNNVPQTSYAPSGGVSLSGTNTWTGAQTFTALSTLYGDAGAADTARRVVIQSNNADERPALKIVSNNLSQSCSYSYNGAFPTSGYTIASVCTIIGDVLTAGKLTTYNNVFTSGLGVPAIYASGRVTAQTAAAAGIATFTPTADGTFLISGNILVTTATSHSFTMTCTYTDEGGTSRTLTMPFTLVAGSAIVTSVANANGAVPYHGVGVKIRAKANTAITIQTTGTFTTVTYNAEADISQVK